MLLASKPLSSGISTLRRSAAFLLFSGLIVANSSAATPSEADKSKFLLGPDDQIAVRALDVEELDGKTVRIDVEGYVNLPLVGRIRVSDLTVQQLESKLDLELRPFVKQPLVTVTLVDIHSRTISVVGSVTIPGVQRLQENKTLVDALSIAGGLRPEAGNSIFLTRAVSAGPLPLAGAKPNTGGNFNVAEVNARDLLQGKEPEINIGLLPGDVLSVPKSELVYVVGAVHRSGGFVLGERSSMSVLTALSMAEGLDRNSACEHSEIIRPKTASRPRSETRVNIKQLLAGTTPDIDLQPNDILFIPSSAAKNAGMRVVEAAIQLGTGIAIYRR